jgi:hypothetical protein
MRLLLLFAVLSICSAAAYVANPYSEYHADYWAVYATPHYYYDKGWQAIDTTIQAAAPTAAADYHVTKMRTHVNLHDQGTDGEAIRIEKNGHALTAQPERLGYTTPLGEVSIKPKTNNVGTPDANTMSWPGYFGDGIDYNLTIYSHVLYKTVTIDDATRLPALPSYLEPPSTGDACAAPDTYLYLDTHLTTDLTIYVNGKPWDGEAVTTFQAIDFKDKDSWVYTIAPGYVDTAKTSVRTPYTLSWLGDTLRLRQLIPYHVVAEKTHYPIVIDPTVIIDNSSYQASALGTTCTPIGNCCTRPYNGVCQEPFSPPCVDVTPPSTGLTIDTTSCVACSGFITCCTLTGTHRRQDLLSFDWAGSILDDYGQVNVTESRLYLEMNPYYATKTVCARHVDDNSTWPDCLFEDSGVGDDHTVDDYSQPPCQAANRYTNWTFTNHTQAEFDANHTKLWVFFSSTDNTFSSRLKIVDAYLNVTYDVDPCDAPFSGDWHVGCDACNQLDHAEDVPGNLYLSHGHLALNDVLTFTGNGQRLAIQNCTLAINGSGGING